MDLAEMLSTIWKSKWIILIVALITAGAVALTALSNEETYNADAVVMVGNLGTESVFLRVDELAASYADLADTSEVMDRVEEQVQADGYNAGSVLATSGENSPFIRITASNNSAEAAVAEANAVSEELVSYVGNLQIEDSKKKSEAVLEELTAIEQQQVELSQEPNIDEARIRALDTVRQSLIRQYEESKTNLYENSLNIVDPATVAVKQETRSLLQIGLGFVLGAVMGAIIGFATESVRKALRHES